MDYRTGRRLIRAETPDENDDLAPDARGRGYATEAAAPWIEGRGRLVALIDPGYHASKRVAEKLGFRLERRIPRKQEQLDLFVRESS